MIYPIINGYAHNAHLLAILSNYEFTKPWIVNNYINLMNWDSHELYIFFQNAIPVNHNAIANYIRNSNFVCPWIHNQRIGRSIISDKWNSIVDFLREGIDSGHYIYMLLDRSFIFGYNQYGKKSSMHDPLVYGYNDKEKIFYLADNYKENKYSFFTCDYDSLENAYNSFDESKEDYLDFDSCIQLIKVREKLRVNCLLDLQYIRSSLCDYVSSTHTATNWTPNQSITYGIGVYERVKEYLHDTIEQKKNIDLRPFHILWDHKKIMSFRLEYLSKLELNSHINYLYKKYIEIEKTSLAHRNLIMKFNITKNTTIINKLIFDINTLIDNEMDIIKELINYLPLHKES